jgi:hypothetical protein
MKKWIKRIVLVLFGAIMLLLIIGLFLPTKFQVERKIEIAAENDTIFNYIKYLKNQNKFSVWAQMDPKMENSYKGTDGEIGFVSSWKSKIEEVGVGSQTITKITKGKRIDTHLKFLVPFENENDAFMELKKITPNKTEVTWGLYGKMPYPLNVTYLFFDMDAALGKDLEGGLQNLKKQMESNSD